MPTYDYACSQCGTFEVMRSIAQREAAALCPGCGAMCQRVLISAPMLSVMSPQKRHAITTNERASHEPRNSRSCEPRAHPSGCSCCSGKASKATVVAPDGSKGFPSKRPWMISH